MVYCVGLTGNIASGKSTVALLFNQLGTPVFNADNIAKEITLKGAIAYDDIVSHFGLCILNDNQQVDRKKLRDIVFANPKQRIWLEQLLHPKIRQQLESQVATCKAPYCVVEIPLLKEKKNYTYINRVLLVTCPIELQVKRIIARDQSTEAQALAIIATQPSLKERLKLADDILENIMDVNELKKAVELLHLNYIKFAHDVTE